MRVVPSFEFEGPHHNSLRIRIGPSKDRIYDHTTLGVNFDNARTYIDNDIMPSFELDVTDFPKEIQAYLVPLLQHPKIKII
jgi:hypothetical protein